MGNPLPRDPIADAQRNWERHGWSDVAAPMAAISQHFYGGNFLANTLITAVILWAGFTAARFITHDAFEGRRAGLTGLNCAHELVTLVVMGLIIGLFGISAA
jgi:hypothetical protein